jgi:pyruvate ferredoxin oxidoreductase alpha subunit
MARVIGFNGNEVVAYAARQCNVDVVAAYPITPQTIVVEQFSKYVADGEVNSEFVCVESEHSAISACVGASLTGARVFTATSSQGLALMHEILYIASGLRCPIVMAVMNRALSAPINIHCDHSDMMGSRDCGCVQIYVENAQEAYDWTIQAFKLGESPEVQLPVTVNLDGFIISHSMEGVEVLEDEDVRKFLPERKAQYRLDVKNPMTFGALTLWDYYFEFKRQQEEAMRKVPETLKRVTSEFRKVSGREYGILQTFGIEDAEAAIVCLGSTAGTAREVARKLRGKGEKVGVIKLWLYRPFPADEVRSALKNVKAVAVMDRALSPGAPYNALCSDVIGAFYGVEKAPKIFNIVYGLGGRDVTPSDIEKIFEMALETAKTGLIREPVSFVGVRE